VNRGSSYSEGETQPVRAETIGDIEGKIERIGKIIETQVIAQTWWYDALKSGLGLLGVIVVFAAIKSLEKWDLTSLGIMAVGGVILLIVYWNPKFQNYLARRKERRHRIVEEAAGVIIDIVNKEGDPPYYPSDGARVALFDRKARRSEPLDDDEREEMDEYLKALEVLGLTDVESVHSMTARQLIAKLKPDDGEAHRAEEGLERPEDTSQSFAGRGRDASPEVRWLTDQQKRKGPCQEEGDTAEQN